MGDRLEVPFKATRERSNKLSPLDRPDNTQQKRTAKVTTHGHEDAHIQHGRQKVERDSPHDRQYQQGLEPPKEGQRPITNDREYLQSRYSDDYQHIRQPESNQLPASMILQPRVYKIPTDMDEGQVQRTRYNNLREYEHTRIPESKEYQSHEYLKSREHRQLMDPKYDTEESAATMETDVDMPSVHTGSNGNVNAHYY